MKTLAKLSVGFVVVALVAAPASAATFKVAYGWEDGTGTILGSFGNLSNPQNVGAPNPVIDTRSLQVSESPIGGTPQAYVAFIENVNDGDIIEASFYGWDVSPGVSPSMRIWAHYAEKGDITSYRGSASGNFTYTAGTGWDQVSHTWTFSNGGDTTINAMVIEARLYSASGGPDPENYWVDNLWVQVTTDKLNASITTPGGTTYVPEPATLAFLGLGGLALLRRRR